MPKTMSVWGGVVASLVLCAGIGLASEPAEIEKFVNARIEIGEMMTNYFQGGQGYSEVQAPSADQMRAMREDINAKLAKLLSKYNLGVDEYRQRSKEVLADEAGVKGYLEAHPDLKKRYEALPFDRMGRGSSGRGY
ncbi:MAG: hypothetical protein U0361_03915 [Nitrospiraceae bacterium]